MRSSGDLAAFLRVRKAPEVECPDCSGYVTFGLGPGNAPRAWHSTPWCESFRFLPNAVKDIVGLFDRVAQDRPELRRLRVLP
mgnify:CR=1 FL=1